MTHTYTHAHSQEDEGVGMDALNPESLLRPLQKHCLRLVSKFTTLSRNFTTIGDYSHMPTCQSLQLGDANSEYANSLF